MNAQLLFSWAALVVGTSALIMAVAAHKFAYRNGYRAGYRAGELAGKMCRNTNAQPATPTV